MLALSLSWGARWFGRAFVVGLLGGWRSRSRCAWVRWRCLGAGPGRARCGPCPGSLRGWLAGALRAVCGAVLGWSRLWGVARWLALGPSLSGVWRLLLRGVAAAAVLLLACLPLFSPVARLGCGMLGRPLVAPARRGAVRYKLLKGGAMDREACSGPEGGLVSSAHLLPKSFLFTQNAKFCLSCF